ncbi:MAG: AAA family ATPase [Chloroflexota bacterium]|nr:AAA family ATPase [Chloroflexota bacterium]
MSQGIVVAISGKGGVGKTNLSALLIRTLSRVGSVLAIDADPDSNLPQALGVTANKAVGDIREEISSASSREVPDKQQALKRAVTEAIEEFPQFDLALMGRPEGPGCYCAVNWVIRQVIDFRASSYDFIVVDCEAGLEHLSRLTTKDVDIMIVVTEPTKNGILTAQRVKELSQELSIDFGKTMVVANKITPKIKPSFDKMAQENNLEISAYIPWDESIARFDLEGKPVIDLPDESAASIAVGELCREMLSYFDSQPKAMVT